MNAGLIYSFKVDRKTDIGYILKLNDEEVFLHNNDTNFLELVEGSEVKAFLYYDFKGRLAATLQMPYITLGEEAFLEVVEVVKHLGVFVNNKISKDLLLSRDDLPHNKANWPQKGDKVFVTIKEKGRLVASRISKQTITSLITLKEKDEVEAYVIEHNNEGITVLTLDKQVVFVHKTQTRKQYRLGEKVLVKVMRVYEDSINGTLIEQKETMIEKDAQLVLKYIKEHKEMEYGNNSTPEEIFAAFNLSKKAFKRALGNLYKNRLIDFKNDKTIYVGEKDE